MNSLEPQPLALIAAYPPRGYPGEGDEMLLDHICRQCAAPFRTYRSRSLYFCSHACYFTFRQIQSRKKLAERFWSHVALAPSRLECWLWHGPQINSGYGIFPAKKGRFTLAHRMAYALFYGSFFSVLHVLHKCDVKLCCNPHHLFLGTAKDNKNDSIAKGRSNTAGELNPQHKLTNEKVRQIRALLGTMPQKDIAQQFDVCRQTITFIKQNKIWIDVR